MAKSKNKRPTKSNRESDCESDSGIRRCFDNKQALQHMAKGTITKHDMPFVTAWLVGMGKHIAKYIPDPEPTKKTK